VKRITLRTGFTVFIIFFGMSVLEAFRSGNWADCIFWLVMAGVFILMDNMPAIRSKADQR
jgi:hypothetical protein